jgi:hypothetical protein
MAINNGFLKVGSIGQSSLVENRGWNFSFPGTSSRYSIIFPSSNDFKVDNETTFFGGDNADAAIKGRVYNDLKLEAYKFNNFCTSSSNLVNFIRSFSLESTSYASVGALINAAYANPIAVAQVGPKLSFIKTSATIYIYAPVSYDDSIKRGYLIYKGNNSRNDLTLKFT